MKKISIFNGIYLYKNPIKQLVGPDLYIASDMMDYRENAPNIKLSFHKRLYNKHIKKQRYDSILISIEDVFIERDKYDKNLFHVSDDTGRHEMIWKKESSKHTFEEAQRKQLLREKDNVDEIIFKYILKYDKAYITSINKNGYSHAEINSILGYAPSFNFS